METGIRSVLLIFIVLGVSIHSALAEVPSLDELQEVEAVIQPDVARVEFDESEVEAGDYAFVPAFGLLSIEDFGANLTLNIRFNYQISDDLYVGAELGRSEAGLTSAETLGGGLRLMTDDQRVLQYYLFNVGYDLLPGEVFITDNVTYNTAVYFIGGLGVVNFAGDTKLDAAIGVGMRLMFADFSSINLEMRDHLFNTEVLGVDKLTNNLELTLGFGFYF